VIRRQHPNLRPWPKGVSGNPKGRPPQLTAIQQLARTYTEEAIQALIEIMRKGKSDMACVAAAVAILDRGWGKPRQAIEHADTERAHGFLSSSELRMISDEHLTKLLDLLHEIRTACEAPGARPVRRLMQAPAA
jgi:Family of unknown function (DUF5681)